MFFRKYLRCRRSAAINKWSIGSLGLLGKMNNFSISTRIFAGFSLVLGLAVAIYLVAMASISSINQGLQKVTLGSIPMLEAAGDISRSLLASENDILQLYHSSDEKDQQRLEKRYQQSHDANNKSSEIIMGLVKSEPALYQSFKDTEAIERVFFAKADTVLAEKKSINIANKELKAMASDVNDIGDEVLSAVYDLEGVASKDNSRTRIANVINQLETILDLNKDAMASRLRFSVMNSKSEIFEEIETVEKSIASLRTYTDLYGQPELALFETEFAKFKEALGSENGVLDKKIELLVLIDQAKKSLDSFQTVSETSGKSIVDFNDKVKSYSVEIKNNAENIVASNQRNLSIIAVLALIAASVVAYFVIISIKKPLNSTIASIQRLATGDLTEKFVKHGNDELGVLAENMQVFVASLREMIQEIASNSEMLAATAEETTTISEQSTDNVFRQKEQTDMMVSSINEMTSTVESVANNVTNTQMQVEMAHEEVVNGEKVLQKNIKNIESLAAETEVAAAVISRLNDDTNNISSVLDVIRSVAEQTNLLALNAAIEAARAGEQGRGFAVVADEVRTLASRTHNSTAEIQTLIERLLAGSGEAVDVMTKSQKETHGCVEGIQEVGRMLKSITNSIDTINGMSLQIASAAEEQSVAAKSQRTTIIHIAEISEQASASAKENQVASQELARMAETQMSLLQRFTV